MTSQSLPDLEGLGLLVAGVEPGGFTAAARSIATPRPLVRACGS